MLKTLTISIASLMSVIALSCALEGAEAVQTKSSESAPVQTKSNESAPAQEKYNIMHRDQVDPTDTLAIPFDESEIEDEEQIDLDEKKDVFNLPHEKK